MEIIMSLFGEIYMIDINVTYRVHNNYPLHHGDSHHSFITILSL